MPANTVDERSASTVYGVLRDEAGAKTPLLTPGEALLAYIGAFSARDPDFISRLFDTNSLAEIPLLKPNRLFGIQEIESGHRAAFDNMTVAEFASSQPLVENASTAIWVGELTVQRVDGISNRHQLAIVAETHDTRLRRLSLYFDARNIRRWADHTIV